MNAKRIIVAHPGQQHSYKTAIALERSGELYKYITTVYNKRYSLTNVLQFFLKGSLKERAIGRHCNDISNDKIKQMCELDGLILLLLQRIDKKKNIYSKWSLHITKRFGIKVARYAIRKKVDAVIVYDTQGMYIGEYLRRKKANIKLIMDVSAANLDYMKKIYEKDMKINPDFKEKMIKERGYLWNEKKMKLYRSELKYPCSFLVPSTFVQNSLRYVGVTQPIYICPYGSYFIDSDLKKDTITYPIKFIYVGNTMALKGIYYLFEAIKSFSKGIVNLTVVGAYDDSINCYKNIENITFVGSVPHEKVKKYLSESDVFIMPSLGEGMCLAVLEAMGMGLPCLVSENSGFKDHIVDKWNGIVFPIQSIDAIRHSIQWIIDNIDMLPKMSKNALETSKKFSWNHYYNLVEKAISNIFTSQ